jgi:TPR repeat protein
VRLPFVRILTIIAVMLVVGHTAGAADAPAIGEPPAISQSDALTLNLWLGRAEQGGADAQFTVGYMYATGQGAQLDYAEAAKWFRRAAEQDHARAQLSMGMLYDNGWGVARDRMEAFRWYLLAAEKGEPQAQTNLGAFYIEGLVGEPNPTEAVKWFRRAAVQGSPRAMISLGSIYGEGLGVMQDYPRALMWMYFAMQTSAATGTPNGALQQAVDRLIQKMSLQQLEEAARLGELCKTSKYTMCE